MINFHQLSLAWSFTLQAIYFNKILQNKWEESQAQKQKQQNHAFLQGRSRSKPETLLCNHESKSLGNNPQVKKNEQNINMLYNQEKIVNQAKLWQVTTQYINRSPHRYIGALTFTEDFKMNVGTAFIISKDTILTAAHNVYDRKHLRENTNFKFYLAPHQRTSSFYEIESWRYPQQFKTCSPLNKGRYDYALMKLKASVKEPQFLALQTICPECKKEDIQLSIFGYPIKWPNFEPADPHSQSYLIHQFGLIAKNSMIEVNFSEGIMKHFINTLGGQSGCPIIANNRIIAIHTGGSVMEKQNFGTLISKEVLNNLATWSILLKTDQFKVFKHAHFKYEGRKITIRNDIDKEECQLEYDSVKGRTVHQVLINSMESARFYTCLLYKTTLLRPEDTFSKIQEEKLTEENEKIQLYFLKHSLRFYMLTTLCNLYKDQDLSKLKYFEKYVKSQDKNGNIPQIISKLRPSTGQKLSQVNKFMKQIINEKTFFYQDQDIQMLKLILAFISILKKMPHEKSVLFRTLPLSLQSDSNVDFGRFLIATPFISIAQRFSQYLNHKSFLRIINYTGKLINKILTYSDQEQHSFFPFSIFYTTQQTKKISSKSEITIYQLIELSGPIKYSNKMLLWIGLPNQFFQNVEKQQNMFGFQLLYIPSLFIFKRWHMEYGWLLRWKQTKVKIILNQADMKPENQTYAYQRNPSNLENQESRIDFLLLLYNQWGFKSDTFIYCLDPKASSQRALILKINEKCIFTDRVEDLEKFIVFQ